MADNQDTLNKLNQTVQEGHLDLQFSAAKNGAYRAPIEPEQFLALKVSNHSMPEITGTTSASLVEEKPDFKTRMALGVSTHVAANAMGANNYDAHNAAELAITMNSKHFIQITNPNDEDLKALKSHLIPLKDGLDKNLPALNNDLAVLKSGADLSTRTVAGSSKTIIGSSSAVNVDLTKVVGDLSLVQIAYNMKGLDNRGDSLPEMTIENNKITLAFPKDKATNIANVLAAKKADGKTPVVTSEQLFGAPESIFGFDAKTGVLTVDKNTTKDQAMTFNTHLDAIDLAARGKSAELVASMADVADDRSGKNKIQANNDNPAPGVMPGKVVAQGRTSVASRP